jgi:hypothetical protein
MGTLKQDMDIIETNFKLTVGNVKEEFQNLKEKVGNLSRQHDLLL